MPEAKANVQNMLISRQKGNVFASAKFSDSSESIKELCQVTSESFRKDGYFRTGDTVTVVDGYVKILGSKHQPITSL